MLSYKIYEAQHDYNKDMEVLRAEKEELLANRDFSNEELNAMLAEIDKRIQDRQAMHMAATASLETRKIVIAFIFNCNFSCFLWMQLGCTAGKSRQDTRFKQTNRKCGKKAFGGLARAGGPKIVCNNFRARNDWCRNQSAGCKVSSATGWDEEIAVKWMGWNGVWRKIVWYAF